MTQLAGAGQDSGSQSLNRAETGQRRRTLDAIFQHPLAHNLEWREVIALMDGIGSVTEKHDGEVSLRVGDQHVSMKKPHGKDMAGSDVMALRHFLTQAGWSPDAPGEGQSHTEAQDFIVVIDHAGAEIYQIAKSAVGEHAHAITAERSHHVRHDVDRKRNDADRDEHYPDDEKFFESVSKGIALGGKIVLIGHGKGQSNEADHLRAYLDKHHKDVAARIIREIVADLPQLTTPELLKLGAQAFG